MIPARSPSPKRAQIAHRQGQVQERRLSPIVVSTAKGLPVVSSWSLLRALRLLMAALARSGVPVGVIWRPG